MTNLAGHDMESILEAFYAADQEDQPQCFVAYTIKGFGMPLQGHKDNHAGLMSPEQMAEFKEHMKVSDGEEWDRFAGLSSDARELSNFLETVPFAALPLPQNAEPWHTA